MFMPKRSSVGSLLKLHIYVEAVICYIYVGSKVVIEKIGQKLCKYVIVNLGSLYFINSSSQIYQSTLYVFFIRTN